MSSWKGKTISMAGKEVLIKSVAQVIPSYCMSMYLIPPSLSDEIQKMLNSFWWGSSNRESRGIKWLSWDKISMPKCWGGVGFRNMHAFNLAVLGKQAWKFIVEPNSLVSRVFQSKYFAQGNFLQAPLGHNPSYAWRSLWSSKIVVQDGAR